MPSFHNLCPLVLCLIHFFSRAWLVGLVKDLTSVIKEKNQTIVMLIIDDPILINITTTMIRAEPLDFEVGSKEKIV